MATWDDAIRAWKNYGAATKRNVVRALNASAVVLQGEIRQVMRDSPRGGKLYRRGRGVSHRASAPGEPPAPDTGRLMGSIQVEPATAGTLVAQVFSAAEYARRLEFGDVRVKPRPAWRPATERVREHWSQIMREYLQR